MLVLLSLVLAACGGNGDEDAPADTTDNGETNATVVAPTLAEGSDDEAEIEPVPFTVGKEIWHSGFHLAFGNGMFVGEADEFIDEVDYFVTIDVNFENMTDSDWGMSPDKFALVSNGNAMVATFASEIPNVPGGLSSNGNLSFIVDETFDAATAEIVVGYSGTTRAHVPLGDGELVALQPSDQEVAGTLTMELLDLTVTGAHLSYDNPGFYDTVEEGSIALTLGLDALSRRDGNWNVFANDFALILPDGSAVIPDSSMLGSLPGSEEGIATSDLSITFLVPDPPAGDYTLRLTPGDWFVGEDGVTEATVDFSLS